MSLAKWKLWTGVVVGVLVLVVFLQNRDPVRLEILFWRAEASQLVVFPVTLLAGFVAGLLVGRFVWRSRTP